jgi:hypothetical protein
MGLDKEINDHGSQRIRSDQRCENVTVHSHTPTVCHLDREEGFARDGGEAMVGDELAVVAGAEVVGVRVCILDTVGFCLGRKEKHVCRGILSQAFVHWRRP